MNDTELFEAVKKQFPNSKLERLKKKVISDNGETNIVSASTIKIYFMTESLPKNIVYDNFIYPVHPYIPKVIQCSKCLRFGHPQRYCRAKEKFCHHCSETHEYNQETCEKVKPRCTNCNGPHKSDFKECPTREAQWKRKKALAQKASNRKKTSEEEEKYDDNNNSLIQETRTSTNFTYSEQSNKRLKRSHEQLNDVNSDITPSSFSAVIQQFTQQMTEMKKLVTELVEQNKKLMSENIELKNFLDNDASMGNQT